LDDDGRTAAYLDATNLDADCLAHSNKVHGEIDLS
jgi:hypothetical protein